MTTFFFRRSVEKAFQLDEPPADLSLHGSTPSNGPHITSAVDDIMYIVNKVIQRSLATSQRGVVGSVIPTIGRVLGSDFLGMIQRKMRDESYPKAAIQGAPPPDDKVLSFLVLINNLDIAADYTKRIVEGRVETAPQEGHNEAISPIADLFPFEHDSVYVTNVLKNMSTTFDTKTTELIGDAIQVAFNQVLKPRMRPILADAFRDVDYLLTEAELLERAKEAEHHDDGMADEAVVKARFEQGWDALITPLRRILTDKNFDKLLAITCSYLSKVLEKRVWSYYGRVNSLGAVRLERDVSGVIGIVVRGGKYGVREVFARSAQIGVIMNMEDDEWEEVNGADAETVAESEIEWKLDADERKRARAMIRD
jgi:conserved oligomeric Golgi complex subunit 4